MVEIALKDVLAKSTTNPTDEVAKLEKLLKDSKFAVQVQSWAQKTGAGACVYSVGLVKTNPFKANSLSSTTLK
jgi:hypothetical protein